MICDDSLSAIRNDVADRRKVVEIGVLCQRFAELLLGLTQLFVLHLQLDLMNLQLVNQPLVILFAHCSSDLGCTFSTALLCKAAQPGSAILSGFIFRLTCTLGSVSFVVFLVMFRASLPSSSRFIDFNRRGLPGIEM